MSDEVTNAKREAPDHLLSLSPEELDAVSGGNDNAHQAETVKVFAQLLRSY